jgi:hypothetical protein
MPAIKPMLDLPVLLIGCVVSRCLELWLEFVDAGVAAPEDGLRGRLTVAAVVISLFGHVGGMERTVAGAELY